MVSDRLVGVDLGAAVVEQIWPLVGGDGMCEREAGGQGETESQGREGDRIEFHDSSGLRNRTR